MKHLIIAEVEQCRIECPSGLFKGKCPYFLEAATVYECKLDGHKARKPFGANTKESMLLRLNVLFQR